MNQHLYVSSLLALVLHLLCVSASLGLGSSSLNSSFSDARFKVDANKTIPAPKTSRPQSCGPCAVGGPNVDVYYWPQSSANTSCLSIIGPTPSPPLAGATTSNGITYWGYTNTEEPYEAIQTMLLTSINGITFKMPLLDPWPDTATPTFPATELLYQPIGKRAYPTQPPFIVEPRAPFNDSQGSLLGNDAFLSGNQTFAASTVVYNGHTLLTATDGCGPVGGGSNGVVTSTLIAFAPGELSSFAAPLNEWLHGMQPGLESRIVPYNFADLPCPPYQTMTDQWYKPESGEPYRPIIAFPSKVLEVDPLWSSCSPWFFTGLDPPTMLHPATALVPLATPAANANPFTIEAKPSPSLEDLPAKTAKAPVRLTQPPRNTATSILANGDPARTHGESETQAPADPGALKGDYSSNDPEEGGGPIPGGTNNSPANQAVDTVANHEQVAAGVASGASPKDSSSNQNRESGIDVETIHSPDGDSEISSNSDPTSTSFPSGTDDTEEPHPIATVGGNPIVGNSQETSSENSNQSDPHANSDETQSDPNEDDDTQHTKQSAPPATPDIDGSRSNYATASQEHRSDILALTPVSSTSTTERNRPQATSVSNTILVNEQAFTPNQGTKDLSPQTTTLPENEDIIPNTSTVSNPPSPFNAPLPLSTQHAPIPTPSFTEASQDNHITTAIPPPNTPPLQLSLPNPQLNNTTIIQNSPSTALPPPPAALDPTPSNPPNLISQNLNSSSVPHDGTEKAPSSRRPSTTRGATNVSATSEMPYQGSGATKGRGMLRHWCLICVCVFAVMVLSG